MRIEVVLTINFKRDRVPLGTDAKISSDKGDNTSSGRDEVLRAIRKNALEFTNSLPKGPRLVIKGKTNAIKNARGETIDHET